MLKEITDLTHEAGEIALRYFGKKDLKIYTKDDLSPVTEADYKVSDFFIEKLKSFGLPVVTEEKVPDVAPSSDYFVIDPIDGTRYFIDQEKHFAILVALISKNRSVMGVTYFPASGLMYTAEKGKGGYLNGKKIMNSQTRSDLVSYSAGYHKHPDAAELIKAMNIKTMKEQESILKMTRLAEGDADFYPRFGKTYEWDTASAQILTEECGCTVWDTRTLQPLEYSKPMFKNHGFVSFRNDLKDKVVEVLTTFNQKRGENGK
jgi:3'(2'), 5'-bisphosphate nucleotidase